MTDGDRKSTSLSVRLLRLGRTIESALRDDHELNEVDSAAGRLFVGQSKELPPTWLGLVSELSSRGLPKLVNQSCSAILFIDVVPNQKGGAKRVMALSFGGGHHSLDPDAFERSFGLRVVLNTVARANLRGLDIATLDATTFQKRIQASRDADLQGFGIDIDRDLLRLAAGSPRDSTFARSVAGKDALTLHAKLGSADVADKCKAALKLYHASDYKKDFGFIDFVSPVRQQDLVARLDAVVFAELHALVKGGRSDLHIALPDVISPDEGLEIGYFGVGLKSGTKQAFEQIAIEDYVAQLKEGAIGAISDMAMLRASHEIRAIINGEGDKKHKRKLYDCLVFEIEDSGSVYVLFGGDWFMIDKVFHSVIEKGFKRILSKAPFVKSTKTKNERAFIKELDKNANLLNLDQVKLSPAGAPGSSLEPCDFLSKAKQFIHLKDGHASAPISHLWNQGVVSAQSFIRDEKFRVDLRHATQQRQKKYKKKGFEKLLPDGRSKAVPSEYTVVFGIMRDRHQRTGHLSLPFFSKVSLRPVADQIQLMGFGIEVHLVERL